MKHDWQLLRVLLKTIKQSNVVCFAIRVEYASNMVALWYLLSFVGIILNKSLLSPGQRKQLRWRVQDGAG